MTADSGEAALRITLFGPMQALVRGEPLPPLRSRKSLYILALLSLRHGRIVEREWLAGTLWPDSDQSQAFANLRPALSALRDALGPEGYRIEAPSRRTLLLNLTGDAAADVAEFDAAIASRQTPALEKAVALYRGPLLEGWAEEWIAQDREARAQDCLKALQTLAVAAASAGDCRTAAQHWRRAATLDPLWDAARRGLMEALSKDGDSNAALQVYREFVETLQSADMRAVPDAETTALYRRLREQIRQRASVAPVDAAPPPVVTGYLPHALTELVGREDEREDVAERLRRSRLVTLAGPGGIGKTRLAVALAHEIVAEYPHGVTLVSLEALAPANDSGQEEQRPILQQIAAALGVKDAAGRSPLAAVSESLGRKRLLLVLDNCEHVLGPCAGVVASLLRECPGLRVLATSREALHIGGEVVWEVPALSVPDPDRLPKGAASLARALSGYDSVRLFAERAEAADKRFTLNRQNARDVALLCSRLNGVPLALELAAARANVLPPAQILAQLDARPLDALTSRLRDVPARHRTLRATLEWSYQLLPPEAQAFLADMGVFRGGWTLEAAQAVRPDANALEMLTLVRDASLINFAETGEGARYSMLETVRQFAAETLETSGHAADVRRRHAAHYARWVSENFDGWKWEKGNQYQEFYARIGREYPNVALALAWGRTSAEDDLLLNLCRNLNEYWIFAGHMDEARRWMDILLRRAAGADDSSERGETRPLNATQRALLMQIRMDFLYAVGEFEAAGELYYQNFDEQRREGNLVGGRTMLFNAAVLLMFTDLRRSLAILEQCLPLEREYSSDGRANPVILSQLALVSRLTGQSARAAAFLSEALEICHRDAERDPHGYARALWVAGDAALEDGDFALAQERFTTVALVARRLGDMTMEVNALCGKAALARQRSDPEREAALMAAVSEAAGTEPPFRQKVLLSRWGAESRLSGGEFAGAEALAREGLTLLRGRARSCRLMAYPLLLLLADAEFSSREGLSSPHRAARLLGAAAGVAARLHLLAPERAERERIARLRARLTGRTGADGYAIEEAAGAALNDEAALEFALSPP